MRPNVSGTLPDAIEITNEFKHKYGPAEVASLRCTPSSKAYRTAPRFQAVLRRRHYRRIARWRGLLLARDKMKKYCRIQVMAFPQKGIVRDPGAADLMEEALKEGCDVIGGLPWYEYTDEEARQHIDICFAMAKKCDHCGAMAGYNDACAAKIVDMVTTAVVTISVNAQINLVWRLDREPKRGGTARVKELLARGANVGTSQDDVNDPSYPSG